MNSLDHVLLASLALGAVALAQEPFRNTRHHSLPVGTVLPHGGIAVGDVDGDGDVDLVIANEPGPNRLLLNDGRGGFADMTSGRLTSPPTNTSQALELADIDGDGDLDLLICNHFDMQDRVHENTGGGMFVDVTAAAVPLDTDWSMDHVVADLDGDGDVDWLVQTGIGLRLYLNDGTGVFTDVSGTNLPGGGVGAGGGLLGCFAADLDGDGDLDLVLPSGASPSSPAVLLENSGAGIFVDRGPVLADAVFAGDLDGDGRIDLISRSGSYRRNLGGLMFAPASRIVSAGSAPWAAIDFDEDGDLDVLGRNAVFEHDGLGNFTARPVTFAIPYGSEARLVDIDGDRDLDVVTPIALHVNFQRQVAAAHPPTLGSPYVVEFWTPDDSPSVPVLAAVSTGAAAVPIPGLGTLRLASAGAVSLSLMFAIGGVASFSTPVPNLPQLVGLELHHQAVTLDPLRPPVLGNAIRDVVQ